MTDPERELVQGGNVIDPRVERERERTRMRRKLRLVLYGIPSVYFAWWIFATVSTFSNVTFVHFDLGILFMGLFSSASLFLVARAGMKET